LAGQRCVPRIKLSAASPLEFRHDGATVVITRLGV
jgi:hypothetical protein